MWWSFNKHLIFRRWLRSENIHGHTTECPGTCGFRETCHVKLSNTLLFGVFVTSIQGVFGYIQDAQCRAGLIRDGMVMHCTHDELCSMLVTLCASDNRPGSAAREKRYVVLVDVYQILIYFEDWDSVSVKEEVELVNAGRPQTLRTPAIEGGIIAFVKPEQWKSCRHIARETAAVQTEGPRSAWRRSFASIPPHTGPTCVSRRSSPLRMALATTQCG